MRNALQEKMADKLKQKGKQRMRPKMGRMDIDYNLMQEAFFKKQHKPSMTPLGDLYYEGAALTCLVRTERASCRVLWLSRRRGFRVLGVCCNPALSTQLDKCMWA